MYDNFKLYFRCYCEFIVKVDGSECHKYTHPLVKCTTQDIHKQGRQAGRSHSIDTLIAYQKFYCIIKLYKLILVVSAPHCRIAIGLVCYIAIGSSGNELMDHLTTCISLPHVCW